MSSASTESQFARCVGIVTVGTRGPEHETRRNVESKRIVHAGSPMGESVVTAIEWYLRVGVVVAIVFAIVVGRIEPSAKGGSILFRMLILPGATLLWPLIVARTIRARLHPAKAELAKEAHP